MPCASLTWVPWHWTNEAVFLFSTCFQKWQESGNVKMSDWQQLRFLPTLSAVNASMIVKDPTDRVYLKLLPLAWNHSGMNAKCYFTCMADKSCPNGEISLKKDQCLKRLLLSRPTFLNSGEVWRCLIRAVTPAIQEWESGFLDVLWFLPLGVKMMQAYIWWDFPSGWKICY